MSLTQAYSQAYLRAVSKLSYATHAMQRTHSLRRNQNTEICNARTRKTQRMQSILSRCAFFAAFFMCMHCVHCGFLIASHELRVLHWGRQLGNRPLNPFSYAYMQFPSCRTQHTQCNRRTACSAIKKPKYATHVRSMQKHKARNRFYPCLRCVLWRFVFRLHALLVLRLLRCIQQLRNRPLSLFSAF